MQPFYMRYRTQDVPVAYRVWEENEYRVPRLDGGVVIDVGAHIGAFARLALEKGASRVVCHEPDLDNFDLLLRNIDKIPNLPVLCRRRALWSYDGEIYWRPFPAFAQTAQHKAVPTPTPLKVPCVSLDSLLALEREVELLKLDCEGGEVPGLCACTSLRKVRRVVGELHTCERIKGFPEPTKAWLEKKLLELGMAWVHMEESPEPYGLVAFWAGRTLADRIAK